MTDEIDLDAPEAVLRAESLERRARLEPRAVELAVAEYWTFQTFAVWQANQAAPELADGLEIHRGWLATLVSERDVAFKKDVIAEFAVSLADGDEEEADIAQAWLLAKQACPEINWPALSVCRAG
jgi:hypothetical protein